MKKTIITGGASGLGLKLAEKLKGEIHIIDINPFPAKQSNVISHKCNLTDHKKIMKILKKIGLVDLIINNAAIMNRESLVDINQVDFNKIMDINVKAPWMVSRFAQLNKNGMNLFINSRHGMKLKDTAYSFSKNTLDLVAQSFSNNFVVKQAFLGPFEGGVSKTGLSQKMYAERSKEKTEVIADYIIDLINSDKRKLLYDEKLKRYYFT